PAARTAVCACGDGHARGRCTADGSDTLDGDDTADGTPPESPRDPAHPAGRPRRERPRKPDPIGDALVARAAAGDRKALAELYGLARTKMLGAAAWELEPGDRDLEDTLQAGWVTLLEKPEQFATVEAGCWEAWLGAIAGHRAANVRERRAARGRYMSMEGELPPAALGRAPGEDPAD